MIFKSVRPIGRICIVLIIIQAARCLITYGLLLFVEKTSFSIDIVSMVTMAMLIIALLAAARKFDFSFSFFPVTNSKISRIIYFCVSAAVLLLIVLSPAVTQDGSPGVLLSLLYSVIITPVFEELIFRGYIWNTLTQSGKSELQTYLISTVIFALWHLGYVDVIWLKLSLQGIQADFLFIMFMKVIVGLCFGIAAGFVRYKTKNTYAAMLTHAVMNLFGR